MVLIVHADQILYVSTICVLFSRFSGIWLDIPTFSFWLEFNGVYSHLSLLSFVKSLVLSFIIYHRFVVWPS